MPDPGFVEFCVEQLSVIGPVTARNMFGGAGLYHRGVMFALIANDVLYLKADTSSEAAFAEEGMEPFIYHGKKRKPVRMTYWQAPEFLFDDPDAMAEWAGRAFAVAQAAKR